MELIPISDYYEERLADERLEEETKKRLRRAQALMHEKYLMGVTYLDEALKRKNCEMETSRNRNRQNSISQDQSKAHIST